MIAGGIADEPGQADDVGIAVVEDVLGPKAVHDGRVQLLREGQHFVTRVAATDAGKDRDLLAAVDDCRGAGDRRRVGNGRGPRVHERMQEVTPVHAGADDVDRQLDPRHAPFDQRLLHRDLHDAPRLLGRVDDRLVLADVVERLGEIDLLEVAGAALQPCDLAGDRDHRATFALGVVETVDQVQRTRIDRSRADTDAAVQLRLCIRGVGGILLVAEPIPMEAVVVTDALEQCVQGVAGHAEDVACAGVGEDVEQDLGDVLRFRHGFPRFVSGRGQPRGAATGGWNRSGLATSQRNWNRSGALPSSSWFGAHGEYVSR